MKLVTTVKPDLYFQLSILKTKSFIQKETKYLLMKKFGTLQTRYVSEFGCNKSLLVYYKAAGTKQEMDSLTLVR